MSYELVAAAPWVGVLAWLVFELLTGEARPGE